MSLIEVNNSDYAFTGLIVREGPPNEQGIAGFGWARTIEKTASLALKDGMDRDRIVQEVDVTGNTSIMFLDAEGKVLKKMEPSDQEYSTTYAYLQKLSKLIQIPYHLGYFLRETILKIILNFQKLGKDGCNKKHFP